MIRYLAFVGGGFAILFVLGMIFPVECGFSVPDPTIWPTYAAFCADNPPTWMLLLLMAWWGTVVIIPVRHVLDRIEASR